MEHKAHEKAMTSSIRGLAESLDTRPKELTSRSGPASAPAERALELLLRRYLCSQKRQAHSSIFLATHLRILLSRQREFQHLSKQKVHEMTQRLLCSQLDLFFP